MKCLLLLWLATLAIPVPQALSQFSELIYDGFDNIASMQRKVRDVVEVNRTPLFDNAPFLCLRKGDKLVKAREDWTGRSGKPVAEPDRINYYVFSDGKYYQLWVEEQSDKLLLNPAFHSADNCLLFDWEVTIANAKALRELLPGEYATSLTIEQYDAILTAVLKEFPKILVRVEQTITDLREARIISIPGHMLVEFRGLAYDSFRNCVYKYSIRIGSSVFSITGRTLLQGPRHVERWEFERVDTDGPNGNPGSEVDPTTAKIRRAEYDSMKRFQDVVTDAIRSKTR